MSNFKQFQNNIKNIGNVWNGNDVYFTQMIDGYSATYKPNYPECCIKDMIIQTLEGTGAANRGNYELTIWKDGKFEVEYFNSMNEIKQYFNCQ